MPFTLATVRQTVKDRLDDDDANDSVINKFINDTQREIFNTYVLPFNQSTFSGTLTVGEHAFDLTATAASYQRIISLRLTDPDGSEKDLTEDFMEYREFRKNHPDPARNDNNIPSTWTTWANKIYFSTPVDQEYTMDLDFIRSAVTLEDDEEVPELPEAFQEILVLGALVRYFERNDDNDIAQYHKGKSGGYDDQITMLINRYNPAQVGKTTTMKNSYRRGRR